MSAFCSECSVELFGEDYKQLAGIADPGGFAVVLCEGARKNCKGGYIVVDEHGKKADDFYFCGTCQQIVDKRDLAQVFAHEHKDLPLDDVMGIQGRKTDVPS